MIRTLNWVNATSARYVSGGMWNVTTYGNTERMLSVNAARVIAENTSFPGLGIINTPARVFAALLRKENEMEGRG